MTTSSGEPPSSLREKWLKDPAQLDIINPDDDFQTYPGRISWGDRGDTTLLPGRFILIELDKVRLMLYPDQLVKTLKKMGYVVYDPKSPLR